MNTVTLFYLFIGMLLQSGAPEVTFAYPYPTMAACEQGKATLAINLHQEMAEASPGNAASYSAHCEPVTLDAVKVPEAAPAPKHTPSGREA